MPIFRPGSPGVFTSERDLSKREGRVRRGISEEGIIGGTQTTGTNPVPKKPVFWILECGYWNDEGTWLDYAKWEDIPIC